MLLLLIFACSFCLDHPPFRRFLTGSKNDPKDFSQTLNHFDALDKRTFNQKYWENTTFLTNDGPMLLYISGEGPSGGIPSFVNDVYARQLGAGSVTLEHRFYGQSCPFTDVKVSDLEYLSSRQALEDLAAFRMWYDRTQLSIPNRKWIIIGGSYSGALSAWSRLKYPDLFIGSLASSGVVDAVYDFYEFDQQASLSVGDDCAGKLRNGTLTVQKLVTDPTTRNDTMKLFGGEAGIMAVGDFMWMMADLTAVPTQYGYQVYLCDTMNKYANDPLQAMVHAFSDVFTKFGLGNPTAYDFKYLVQPTNLADRMWWWQKCSELAYFQVYPPKGFSIRSSMVNLTWHHDRCERAYGISNTQELVNNTQWHYGSTRVFEETSNTFFTNGSQDPWQRATVAGTGPTKLRKHETGNAYQKVICETCGHCVDMDGCPDNTCDQELKDVQSTILENMKKWLK